MFNISKLWKSWYQEQAARSGKTLHTESAQTLCRFTMAKLRLASNPGTAPEVLRKLVMRGSPEILERVAENNATDVITLIKLAYNEWPQVRSAVASNEKLPVDIITSLSADESVDVRFVVAENHKLPKQLLEYLVKDENPFVPARARRTLKNLRAS